jgi:hypothetical protein
MTITSFRDQILPHEMFASLLKAPKQWTYFGNPKFDGTNYPYWSYRPLFDRKHNLADISTTQEITPGGAVILDVWTYLRDTYLPNRKMVRGYWNAYNYGMDGAFHTDAPYEGGITTIVYFVPQWDPNWAGETVVKNGTGYECCMPAPNRGFFFPSSAYHVARPSSRRCGYVREVLVIRSQPLLSEQAEVLSAWLVANGALKFNHKLGTIHDHLLRCYLICEQHKLPREVCLAAGLHAVYGTSTYNKQMFQPDDDGRQRVMQAWGPEIEAAAYWFSQLKQRTTVLEQGADNPTPLFLTLQLAEYANIVDTGGDLQRWPRIKQTWDTWGKLANVR